MFNIGDHVRIKDDADKIESGFCCFAESMKSFLGHEDTICGEPKNGVYALSNCKGSHINYGQYANYYWFDENWLEPADNIDFSLEEDEIIKMIKKEK